MTRAQAFRRGLFLTCWIPPLLILLAVGIQALRITGKATEYVALGKIGFTFFVRNDDHRDFSDRGDSSVKPELTTDFLDTQAEILKGGDLRRRTLDRVHGLHPEFKDVDVATHITRSKNFQILNVSVHGPEPNYTRAYLNALLDEYISFRRKIIDESVSTALGKLIQELQAREKVVNVHCAALADFVRKNDVGAAESESERLRKRLAMLRDELDKLRLDAKLAGSVAGKPVEELVQEKIYRTEIDELDRSLGKLTEVLSQWRILKAYVDTAEKELNDWKATLDRFDTSGVLVNDIVAILERPVVAMEEEPALGESLAVAGIVAAFAGLLIMLLAATIMALCATRAVEASPPSLP